MYNTDTMNRKGNENLTKLLDFTSYEESVPGLLRLLRAGAELARQRQILIKPNLVNASPHPVTTPVGCCEAIVKHIRRCSRARVLIAEGCGTPDLETPAVFERLGYRDLSERLHVPLVDLNQSGTVVLERGDCEILPRMHLPSVALDSYVISVPVLKVHSIAGVTGTMKNMMGFAPPEHYQCGGHWKKSFFHTRMHESIVELNRYVTPDLTVLDASVGLAEFHLGGAECDPPVRKLLGGRDPLAVDRHAAELLGLDWRSIPHLSIR